MSDPIKQIIETEKFKIFVWSIEPFAVSFKDHLLIFRDMAEVKDINLVTERLIKEFGG